MLGCPACGESNPERARFCLACGNPLAVDEPTAELRRNVSIIFADLVGSTVLGESLDAEALRYVTGRYFDAMRAAVERHEGAVEKFIGDAVVAVFGVPRVREDDALRAVRAAADMRVALTALNDELQRELSVTLQVRIGINTGEVIVGERRAGGSLATGDAVNVAARLEQAAGPGEVLIGSSTHRLVRDHVTVEPAGSLDLKGKAESVVAWRLVAVAAPHVQAPDADVERFVGRDSQLHLVEEAFRRVETENTCQLVTILGAAGIGKSRLAEEFTSRRSDALVLVGRCLSYGQGATYWPLREAVLHAVALTGDESGEEVTRRLTAVLDDGPDTANVVSRLLTLVTLNRDEAVPEDMPWAVRMFLEQLARQQPVVLVVDDLHWAEPGLLDVLEHVTDWSREAPIMVLGLARPEFYDSRPTWGGGKFNATAMLLSALDDSAAASLVARHDLPDAVRQQIVDAAGGNPLFVQQLVAMLVDEGYAALRDGDTVTWVGGPAAQVTVTMPPSVSALLTARIDRLSEPEQSILGGASVMGSVFYVEGLATLSGQSPPEVRQQLEQLVRKELLRATASDLPGLSAYRFLHVLVRDAAYDGLSKAHRAQWHEQVADWLEGLDSDAIPEEIIGHHLAAAWEYRGQLGPTTDHTRALAVRAAGKLAGASRRLDLSDVTSASSLMQHAIDLLEPSDPRRTDYLLSLSMQLLELGNIDRSRKVLAQAAATADPRQAVLAEVLQCRANGYTADHRIADSERVLDWAIRRFEEWGDQRGLANAYLAQADVANYQGQIARGSDLLALAMKHGEAARDASSVARARSVRGILTLFGPCPAEEGIASLEETVQMSGNDPRVRAEAEQVTCVLHAMCGRFDRARQLGANARQHLAEVGHALFLANLAQSTGHVEELIGDLDAAEREYERSRADLEALGENSYLSTVAGLHARLLARRGKLGAAEEALEIARANGAPDDVTTQTLISQAAGLLAATAGDADGARAALAEAIAAEPVNEVPDSVGEALRTAADVEQILGDVAAEQAHLLAARSAFQAKGNIVRAQEIDRRLRGLAPG